MSRKPKVSTDVAAQLAKLASHCDTGFALAVHIRFTSPSLLYQTYAKDWINHYSQNGLMMQDPTVHWGLSHLGGTAWSALRASDPAGVIAAAETFGLTNGMIYAVGPATSRTLCGYTKSGAAFTPAQVADCEAIVDEIHALTEGIEHFSDTDLAALRALHAG